MSTVRSLVDDGGTAWPLYKLLGSKLADRCGPPFAAVQCKGLTLWLSGPGASARKTLASGCNRI